MPTDQITLAAGTHPRGPDLLIGDKDLKLTVAGITVTFAVSTTDKLKIVFLDTDDRYEEIERNDPDGHERPASEQGRDLRILLNDYLIHGRHLCPAHDETDLPRYAAYQIDLLNPGVLHAEKGGVEDPAEAP
jgi:hypothetical protein